MAGDAVIGSLRVDLGLSTGAFEVGIKRAQTLTDRFGVQLTLGVETVARAVGRLVTLMPSAIKASIDHADSLSKAAQRAGTTVEVLSRLSYAASFSEISLDDVTASLGKLSKAMTDTVQNPTGNIASAFAALGVSVTDSSGKLRDTNAVFTDLADRFSKIEDGAVKTSIAMTLFGRSGASLIPLLNEGSAGLQAFAAESDRVGNTISTRTAAAANKFNDTLEKLHAIFTGIINRLSDYLLPLLQSFADKLLQLNPEILKWGTVLGGVLVVLIPVSLGITAISSAAGVAIPVVAALTAGVVALNTSLLALAGTFGAPALLAGLALLASTSPAGGGEDKLIRKLGLTNLPSNTSGSPDDRDRSGIIPIVVHGGNNDKPDIDLDRYGGLGKSAEEAAKKAKLLRGALEDIGPAGQTAADMASERMRNLGDTVFGSLANVGSALSSLFGKSKAFAVATAVLQGLQGVAYALGSSAPPWNFVNAAAVGIEAAANVANILATSENSTSMPTTAGGGAGQAAAGPTQGSSLNITLRGSGVMNVQDIGKQLAAGLADGGHPELAQQIKIQVAG